MINKTWSKLTATGLD